MVTQFNIFSIFNTLHYLLSLSHNYSTHTFYFLTLTIILFNQNSTPHPTIFNLYFKFLIFYVIIYNYIFIIIYLKTKIVFF